VVVVEVANVVVVAEEINVVEAEGNKLKLEIK
jgi:hypothetical protein